MKFMKSPIEGFFKLGDKVTGGDPKRMMDWNYAMLWIIFFAFFGIFLGNVLEFFQTQRLANLGWACFGMAIMWFQYGSLKQMYEARKMMKQMDSQPTKQLKVESVDDMLKEFKKDGKKG
ncbi:MAG TPA: hypothetical protein ENG87_03995 [Candidatus Pacearchaeota archaeon]|nr:hypothetical protein [Candidatus Pacearchaeota archaeon]HDZ61193.1 hypothetical protein [Candidatus Pacearchaeota archaeon]